MNATYSKECDEWMARQLARNPPAPITGTLQPVAKGKPVPACPLTDAEFAWLWPRFQKCRFGGIRAAKSFARTSLECVTPRGKNFAVRMAYRHRTQILASARKMTQDEFLGAVRTAAAKPTTTETTCNAKSPTIASTD